MCDQLCHWRQAIPRGNVRCRGQVLENSTSIIDSDHLLITLGDRGRSHSGRSLHKVAGGEVNDLVQAGYRGVRRKPVVGTTPNLPSCLRSDRYVVITGPSATRGQHCNSATSRQLTQFARRCSSFTTSGAGPLSTTRARRPLGPSHPAPGDFGCFLIQKL